MDDQSARLRETYAAMGDGELHALANEAFDLTDLAKAVLQQQLTARGLDFELKTARDPVKRKVVPLPTDLVVATRVWDEEEARIAKEYLDAANIPSYFDPEATFDNGKDLKVRDIDHQQARWVLSHIPPADAEPQGEYVPACPECSSPEIVFVGIEDDRFHWTCDACGHQWIDDGNVG